MRPGAAIALLFVLLLLIGAVAGCAPKVIHGCPPVPVWTDAESAELADELDALPPDFDKIERAVSEGFTMRQQARDCAP